MDWELFIKIKLDKLEELWFKYFSSSTLDSKDCWVRYVVYGIMFIPFVFGFFFTIIGYMDLARLCGWILVAMLVPFAVVWIIIWIYHYWKLRKFNKHWE
jgi:hypothetical protein